MLLTQKTKSRGGKLNVAFVSTYLPTQCGIAKFTHSLRSSLLDIEDSINTYIVRITVPGDKKIKGKNVYQINKRSRKSYLEAAEFINKSDIHVVNIQHEFGIFGGTWGKYVLDFMKRVKKPIVTVLHTLEPNQTGERAKVFKEICRLSKRVIVLMPLSSKIMERKYQIDDSKKVVFIPHGVPKVDEMSKEYAKKRLGLIGKYVMVSFGLISSGKGFQYAIDAVPDIIKRHENFVYVIIGQTHPNVKKVEGDAYLNMLKERVRKLGLQNHVSFIEKFFPSEQELSQHILAGDIFVAPYLAKNQISSGTLVYAMAHKMCIITTAFIHAKHEINGKIGFLVKHKNSKMIAKVVNSLLDNPSKMKAMQENAYERVKDRQWPNIAAKYLELFRNVLSD